jgi:hypothetical protein
MAETQNQRIVDLLRDRGERGLTPVEALGLVGSFRLAARVNDIRDPRNQLLAKDEEVVTENVTADGKTFARYVLRKRAPSPEMTLWD